MIFTVGDRQEYEAYIDEDENPMKRKGGSVWRFWREAHDFLVRTGQEELFGIYAVEADWRDDAVPTGFEWKTLNRDAKLVRIRR